MEPIKKKAGIPLWCLEIIAWKNRVVANRLLPLLVIILLNVIVIFILGAIVVYHRINPDKDLQATLVSTPPPVVPPPELPPDSGGGAANPLDPNPVVIPPPTAPSTAITSKNPISSFNTSSLPHYSLNLSTHTAKGNGLTGLGGSGTRVGAGIPNFFGKKGEGALSGYFYDLKQTRDNKSTNMDYKKYETLLTKFCESGFNESLLQDYFKSPDPLSTTVIAISPRHSDEAPKAFNVENQVEPGFWGVFYQGQVIPAESGDYQFVGFADDVMVVAINGHVVLDAGVAPIMTEDKQYLPGKPMSKVEVYPHVWSSLHAPYINGNNGRLRIGKTFHVEEGMSIKMQVLIGDESGDCTFYLLIKNKDKNYSTLADGTPQLPLLQLTKQQTYIDGDAPPMAPTPVVWKPDNQ